ncbi:Gfo/Idh/MocA family protein [Actinopolymorpha alba]|uniref:Gfo/Idh/MocA family protein n=1 Tax=Actinopolymorpha alba TaxID=533267 RepID=UPI0003768740|nr:Gfo/Idh/MocA family oxidoreductase [Actinopolymorpha alba]
MSETRARAGVVAGVIGTGDMARTHTAAWQRLGVDVVVFSRSAERGQAFAAEHGVTAITDQAELLARVGVVDICTPTDTHAELAQQAAAAGRHVICEKPLARTYTEGRAMIDACASAGVGLFAAQVLRYFPAYVAARDAMRSGRIGEPKQLRFWRTVESPAAATWFRDLARSGGVLVDLAIHDLDFARWLAGDVTQVLGQTTPGNDGPPVHSSATLTHAGGVTSEVTAIWDVPGTALRSTFEISGDEGVLRFDSAPAPVLRDGSGTVLLEDDFSVDPYAEQLGEFLDAIAGRTQSRVSAEDGLVALTIALAGEESARTGVPVDPATLAS